MMNKIYGNSFALQTFSSMFKSGRIPHAFLIFGEKGLGKKTLANYLAAALLCEKSEGRPCGECHSCKIAEKKSHPILFIRSKAESSTHIRLKPAVRFVQTHLLRQITAKKKCIFFRMPIISSFLRRMHC